MYESLVVIPRNQFIHQKELIYEKKDMCRMASRNTRILLKYNNLTLHKKL